MTNLVETIMNEKNTKDFIAANLKNKFIKEFKEKLIFLMVRCFKSINENDRTIKDVVILAVLLKYAISMLDSFIILVSEGAIVSSFLPARALFEIKLYIKWILLEDSLNRAKHYFVWNKRAQIMLLNGDIKGTEENTSYTHLWPDVQITQNDENQARKTVNNIKKLLSTDEFKGIDDKFNELKKDRVYEPYWYKLSGCKSIWDMVKKLSKKTTNDFIKGEYKYIYSNFSNITHCADMNYQVNLTNNFTNFEPIRNPAHIMDVLPYVCGFILDIYRGILNEYRPDEIEFFRKEYIQKWQKEIMNIPTINCTTITINLDTIF